MNLDVEAIAKDMVGAAKGVVGDKWPTTRKYFESESKIFAERLAGIAKMRKAGMISEERAKQHLAFQTEAWETVLLAVDGLSQLMVEQALNAAIKAIQDAVNKALGFALL
jgi:Asp-tRNA(Asn)/Glu-tRNA(Gln) amidotransferase B subunit